jgi:gamma-glutamyltranspeptidase/glutathione hydrolase
MSGLAALLSDDAPAATRRADWLRWAEGRAPAARAAEIRAALAACRGADQTLAAEGPGAVGAVATGSPHATRIGMDALRAGGTAADAAAAAAFAMMVADPPNASPAGRAHILWARPGGAPQAIDGATAAPAALAPGGAPLPVPGAVRAVLALHAAAGRLPLSAVAGPARALARDGFAAPAELARVWAWRAPEIADPDARRVYLPAGRAPRAGETFAQPGLAAFFDRLIETGRDPFADPDWAAPFCERLAAKGAQGTPEDLAAAAPRAGETVTFSGEGWRAVSIGRQGWGATLLRILELTAPFAAAEPADATLAHLAAVLNAFAERTGAPGEPLPADPAAALAAGSATTQTAPPGEDRDTTHLSVVDRDGMRVALTQSIGPHFGARIAEPQSGILIAHSYRMAEAPAPGARDVTEQCPCLLDIGADAYALGGAGSERIPSAVAAVIRRLLDGAPLADALAAPRAHWMGDHARLHVDAPPGVEAALARAGARAAFVGRGPVDHIGLVQAVARRRDGAVSAAADPAYAGAAAAA